MTKMTKDLQVQAPYAEARLVCEAIHGDFNFAVLRFKRGKAAEGACGPLIPAGSGYASFNTFDEHVKKFPQYQREGLELFAVIGVTDGLGHSDANVLSTWALALDFDDGYPKFLINNPLISPSFRVWTSKGRYHAVWVLSAACTSDEAKLMLKAMTLRLGGDVAYAKVSQIIRLPGFTHHKHGTVPTLFKMTDPLKTFTLAFLKLAFDVVVIQNHLRAVVPRLNDYLEVVKDKSNRKDEDNIIADVESALPYLKDFADDYTGWFSTLSALARLGDAGKELAKKFSRYSDKFDAEAFERKWTEVQKSPGNVPTIFLRAQAKGWVNPGYRNQVVVDKSQTLTDRDFGRMIAAKMGDNYAVLDSLVRGARKLTFFQFGVNGYQSMSDIDKRAAVEKSGKAIVADLTEHHNASAETIKRLQHKIGNNRTLDEVCDHVAEVLIGDTKRRVIGDHPYFVVANGVLNLLNQELVPVRYKAVPVKGASPVVYDPTATAPVFEKTIDEVFEGNAPMIRYFMQVIGYLMLGAPKEQIFLVIYGPSAGNGKNTLMDTIEHVMGGYAMKLPSKAILVSSHVNDGATPSTARMDGKRMVVVSEPSEKHQLDSGAVKSMVGDLTMPVRDNYESAKDIKIEFVLALLANKLPKVQADDHGLWRRAKIIPFTRTFRGDEVDADLPSKLRAEASGILNLMLIGAQDYLVNGLVEPEKVTAATAEERESVDTVVAFLKDTMLSDAQAETPMKMIYQMYANWHAQNGTYVHLTKQALGKGLVEKGFKKSERGHLVYYHGLIPIEVPDQS